MAQSGTYARTSPSTTLTVTVAGGHGLSTGMLVSLDFTSGTALDSVYTITVTGTTTFTVTTVATTTTSGNVTIYNAYSISGSYSVTFYKASHGYIAGNSISIIPVTSFSGTYPWNSYRSYDWVVSASNLTADSFQIDGPVTMTTNGAVELGKAMRGTCAMAFSATATLSPIFLRQVGTCAMTFEANAVLTPKQLVQTGICTMQFRPSITALTEITRIQLGECAMDFRATVRVTASHPARGECVMRFSAQPVGLGIDMPATALQIRGRFQAIITGSMSVTRGQDTYRDLLDNAATCFGRRTAAELPNDQRDLLVTFAAAAVQEMFSRAEQLDHFNRLTRDMTLAANTNTLTLANDVQSLQGFVRITATKRPLAPVQTEAEIERYATLFLTAADDTTVPHAYYAKRQSAETAYGMTTTLVFSPQPTEAVPLQVEVLLAAPRYTWANYEACTALSIARRYVASVLVPLVRMQCAATRYFNNATVLPEIKAQYAQARAMLGYTDTTPRAAKSADNPPVSTALATASASN